MVSLENLRELLRPYYLKWLYFKLSAENRPRYLADCWRQPHYALGQQPEGLLSRHPERPDFLFLPMTDWHSRIQRTQHLAAGLGALGSRCFYLNPHLGRQFPDVYSEQDALRVGLAAPQVLELHVHLPREPVHHHRLLSPPETDRLVDGISRLVRGMDAARVIQMVSFPLWLDVAERLKREFGFPIVYDCHDLLSGFPAVARCIVAAEPRLLEQADLVCFTSQWLMDEVVGGQGAIAGKSILVRNGINPEDYAGVPERPRSGRPTIGYAGSLDFWFDLEAIRQAATRHPEWDFVLIGRLESAPIGQLGAMANIRLEGEIPYAELPARLAALDVALIPFLKMPLTLATNPIKLYEYFGLGLPVVAARLPEIELFQDLMYLYDGADEFVRQLEKAVVENAPELRARRQESAANNSWRARCEQLIRLAANKPRMNAAPSFAFITGLTTGGGRGGRPRAASLR